MRRLISVSVIVAVVATAGTVAAQGAQRFPDVPPDHDAFEAVEWAAEVGLTLGYTDGTFRPDVPLHKAHAVIFMERYYDQILGAAETDRFTRGDMMQLLHEIAGQDPEPPQTSIAPPERIGDWFHVSGETVDGEYDGYLTATSDKESAAIMVLCWDRRGLEAMFFSASAVFDRARAFPSRYDEALRNAPSTMGPRQRLLNEVRANYSGRVEWRFGDGSEKTTDYLAPAPGVEALRMTGDTLDAFLDALAADKSGEFHLVLWDGSEMEGRGTIQASGGADVANWASRCEAAA